MENEKFTITLADGTQITGLSMNGNCFISNTEIEEYKLTDDNLLTVTINEETYENMTCDNLWEDNGEWWFILREKTKEELKELELNAKIEFLMAMQGVIE